VVLGYRANLVLGEIFRGLGDELLLVGKLEIDRHGLLAPGWLGVQCVGDYKTGVGGGYSSGSPRPYSVPEV
jgi:hypothetical protein